MMVRGAVLLLGATFLLIVPCHAGCVGGTISFANMVSPWVASSARQCLVGSWSLVHRVGDMASKHQVCSRSLRPGRCHLAGPLRFAMRDDSRKVLDGEGGFSRASTPTSIIEYRLPILKEIGKLEDLVEILKDCIDKGGGSSSLTPREACVASNHLVRLLRNSSEQRSRKVALQQLSVFAGIAAAGMESLGSKHIALSLNAARHLKNEDQLFEAALKRLHTLTNEGFGVQNIALIFNAFAAYASTSARFASVLQQDTMAEPRMLSLALSHRAQDFTTWQSVSSCLNAASSMKWSSEHMHMLLKHLRGAITGGTLSAETASIQACALIANACANSSFRDDAVMQKLSAAVQALKGPSLSAQGIAMLMNACSRLDYKDEGLIRVLCATAQSMPHSSLNPRTLSLLLNGMSGLGVRDVNLLDHLADAVSLLTIRTEGLGPQDMANIVNAYARLKDHNIKVFSHMAVLLVSAVNQSLVFKDVELAAVCNAYSKTLADQAKPGVVWHSREISQRVVLAMGQAACQLDGLGISSAASILNSYARLGLWDSSFLDKVSACVLAADDIPLGDAVQLYHSVASLYFRHTNMQEKLAAVISRSSPHHFTLQSLGNCAWAAAVLDEQHQGIHEVLESALDVKFEEFLVGKEVFFGDEGESNTRNVYHDLQELRQVHQYLLSRRLSGFKRSSSGGRAEVCQSVFEARSRNRSSASALQARVEAALRDMGFRVRPEQIDSNTGYSIDLVVTCTPEWLRQVGAGSDAKGKGGTFAVEVDGPAHFAMPDRCRPLGSTILKKNHLERMGWRVVSIPFFEWNILNGREEREAYLSSSFMQSLDQTK